ncbi:hypothetical protein G9A89_002427 [Geosiphon pyriformis]|nr:hypothetical protein G9A89_002427 [Geosiphon pyriformis]
MTTTKAKSKKVANSTFSIVTNKVLTRKGLFVIEAARQNILVTFLLKNSSKKLPLAASGLFSSPLVGSSSPVKVFLKRHTWVSLSVVSTTSKSPKIFNNRPVNKLVFSALTTFTTSAISALQMTAKAKNYKKQHSLFDMDDNSNNLTFNMNKFSSAIETKQSVISDDLKNWTDQIKIESSISFSVFGVADGINKNSLGRWSLLLCLMLHSRLRWPFLLVLQDAVKLFCSLTGATKVAIGNKIFLTTLKITQSSGVASVSSSSLLVVLCDISLGTSSNNIKNALGIFGVVTSGLSVIEAAKQNVLAIFPLKNISDKLSLAVSGLFSFPLAGNSSLVKVPLKRHTWVSPSVVFTTSKSPKIFNNRPVNKLVFSALTISITISTTTASQMAAKTVTTALVIPNPFVVPNEIFGRISTAAASPLPNMDGNSSGTSPKMGQDQLLAVLPNVIPSGRSLPIPIAKQFINSDDLKDWADQIKIESTLLPGCIGLKSVSRDAVKLFCVEFASQECLNGATKVAIGDEIFLTTFKIAWSSKVASVSFLFLSVVLHNVSLSIFSDDIKTALGIFGVVTSVKLKPTGLWQYTVVNFKDIFSAIAALFNWFVLVRKDSIRIFLIVNQKEIISSRDAFKAKLVNLLFGCTVFEISNLVSQVVVASGEKLLGVAAATGKLPLLPPKLPFNTFGGPKNFKFSFVGSKFYAKAAAFVVPPGAAAADMELNLGGSPKIATPVVSAVSSVSNTAVESRLASFESHLSELSVLIKFLVEPVSALIVLVTKLLSTLFVVDMSVKEYVDGLAKQNKSLAAVATIIQKRLTCLETISEWICLENRSNVDDMIDDVDDDDDKDKDFSVYDNTFDVIMQLWEDQSLRIKSSPDQTAKWMSSMVKNSHELVSIMDAFKTKLVNLPFGCTAFEISDLVSQVGGCTCFIPCSPDSYRLQCFVVIWLSVPLPKGVVSLLSVVSSGSDIAVNARLASLETQLSELSLLIKSIIEPVGFLVVLFIKLLFTPSVMAEAIKESVVELRNQINGVYTVASVL